MLRPRAIALLSLTAAVLSACDSATAPAARTPPTPVAPRPAPTDAPLFGFDAAHSGSSDAATGITAAGVGSLAHRRIGLPGTVDSTPIFLHAVTVSGARRDVFLVTTTYGRTLAIDAASGRILWRYAPPDFGAYEGSARITNATPAADPGRDSVYAAAPDGFVRKLALSDGHQLWEARVTRDPTREKLASALNVSGRFVLTATGGYIGDAPPYQGHVVAVDRARGTLAHVFNTLCAGRRTLQRPSSCAVSDSAIWSRAGPVVEPGSGRILITTGNGPYDGRTNFGDSLLELTPSLQLRQAFAPRTEATLNSTDSDFGSAGAAPLPGGVVLAGGKDARLRVLDATRLNGRRAGRPFRTGGELQVLDAPGRAPLLYQPAVWHRYVFVATDAATAAYRVRAGRLHKQWGNTRSGTSPVVAGGLLYVYDPDAGAVNVYEPAGGRHLATLACGAGHWQSPAVAGGYVAIGVGNANDHATRGALEIWNT